MEDACIVTYPHPSLHIPTSLPSFTSYSPTHKHQTTSSSSSPTNNKPHQGGNSFLYGIQGKQLKCCHCSTLQSWEFAHLISKRSARFCQKMSE